jgi:hypothetical protein
MLYTNIKIDATFMKAGKETIFFVFLTKPNKFIQYPTYKGLVGSLDAILPDG